MSKKSEGKYKPTLVYPSFIEHIARVREYGVNKHGHSEDWRTTPKVLHIDAIQRHINAYISGEEFDQDSGLPHLALAATNIMLEIERQYGSGIIEALFLKRG
jgi:hypothetical protein